MDNEKEKNLLTARYDLLDRLLKRCTPEESAEISLITRWQSELLDRLALLHKLDQPIRGI
jgi:hypothetical protein